MALSNFSKTGLTDIQDIVPFIRFLVSDGWWMTGDDPREWRLPASEIAKRPLHVPGRGR
jgi:hypothetical protein